MFVPRGLASTKSYLKCVGRLKVVNVRDTGGRKKTTVCCLHIHYEGAINQIFSLLRFVKERDFKPSLSNSKSFFTLKPDDCHSIRMSEFKKLSRKEAFLGPVHTYPDIFENASFFIRFQKDSRPHEERFQKYPRPHRNAVTLTIRYSITKFHNR